MRIHEDRWLWDRALYVSVVALLLTACGAASSVPILMPAPGVEAAGKVRLMVAEDGLYRVGRQELARVGLDLPVMDPENMRLSEGGEVVPFLVLQDQFVFYGQAPASRYAAQRAYVLERGHPGSLMQAAAVASPGASIVAEIPQTLHLEENLLYTAEARQEEEDAVWFWHRLPQQESFSAEFQMPPVLPVESTLRLHAWGFSQDHQVEPDHDLQLLLNDQTVGSVHWDGQSFATLEARIPAGLLQEGTNSVTVDNRPPGAASLDIVLIDWIEVDYLAPATAEADRLSFEALGGAVRVSGFSGPPLIVDVTDARQPQQLVEWRYESGRVELPTTPGQRVAAAGPAGFLSPAAIVPMRSSQWRDPPAGADLIIISTDELAPALEPLVQAREAQGLKVATVPVMEIYDEFGHGVASPESIQTFVAHAVQDWPGPQPHYLLLVGDATTDYHSYLAAAPENAIPSLLVPVQFSGETVSDSRLADTDGDTRPDLAVGRWPARTAGEVASLVQRTLDYERAAPDSQVLFAADGSEARFRDLANYLAQASQLPEDGLSVLGGPTESELLRAWQKGSWLVAYVGHGSINRWGKDDVLTLKTARNLQAETPPIVLQLTCLTGLFAHPQETSLAEAMLNDPGGPVLTIAASSLTLSSHQEPFALQLLKNLQDPRLARIGDAFQDAKLALDVGESPGLREVSDTFVLFGDPSALIARPHN